MTLGMLFQGSLSTFVTHLLRVLNITPAENRKNNLATLVLTLECRCISLIFSTRPLLALQCSLRSEPSFLASSDQTSSGGSSESDLPDSDSMFGINSGANSDDRNDFDFRIDWRA